MCTKCAKSQFSDNMENFYFSSDFDGFFSNDSLWKKVTVIIFLAFTEGQSLKKYDFEGDFLLDLSQWELSEVCHLI